MRFIQNLRLREALSDSDEQAIRLLFNSTADQLGIARPLDPVGWHKVKDYLRSQTVEEGPEEWMVKSARIHARACEDLEMDPYLPVNGFDRVFGPFLNWITSPADRNGVMSEYLRGLCVFAVTCLFGAAALLVARHCGVATGIWPFVVGGFLGMFVLGIVISSDTGAGACGLFYLSTGVYSLATGDWLLSEWIRIIIATVGVALGSMLFVGWLGISASRG